jgi:nitrate reductase gamma subunit
MAEARWHVSAHGQIMCLDCHGDVGKEALHPDPANVNQLPGSFFRREQCTGCHDAVLSELEAGRHGGKPLEAGQDYQRCRDCHDPHTQPRISNPGAFDPARPAQGQCGSCHEPRDRLPTLPPADEACMACHRWWALKAPGAAAHSRVLCLACHGPESPTGRAGEAAGLPILDLGPEGFRPHQDVACLTCHPQAAQYEHRRQTPGDCRQCHVRHDEAVAHDAHLSVTCGACHLKQVSPRKDKTTGRIGWAREPGNPSRLHAMALTEDEGSCRRCHHSRNAIGAAAMVLPAKSILCMPCHAATFSAADTTTVLALIVFAIGLAGSLSYWFSGSLPGVAADSPFRKAIWIIQETLRTVFSIKIFCMAKNLVLDGLLQLKFYRISPSRWLTHGLMVWPFVLRFLWGIVALMASLWATGRDWPWAMLDKNHPVHGMFFDATGLMIIVGAAAAILRSASGPSAKLPAMPRHDHLASGLLGAIVVVGFVLEGMRIAMTGYPSGSAYAFVGDAISRFFFGVSGLEDIYGYVWYIHAVLTGAFVAYLPFSRMFHIVLTPALLALKAAERSK